MTLSDLLQSKSGLPANLFVLATMLESEGRTIAARACISAAETIETLNGLLKEEEVVGEKPLTIEELDLLLRKALGRHMGSTPSELARRVAEYIYCWHDVVPVAPSSRRPQP